MYNDCSFEHVDPCFAAFQLDPALGSDNLRVHFRESKLVGQEISSSANKDSILVPFSESSTYT